MNVEDVQNHCGDPGGYGDGGSGTGSGSGSGGSTGGDGTGNTGGSSPHGGDPGGNGGSNPTTDPGTSDPPGVPNIPGATAMDQKRFQIYLGSLPQNQSDFIIQTPLLTCGFEFLKANNFSAFSKDIVSWAAEYYCHNTGTEIDDYKPYLEFAAKFLTDNPDTVNPQFIFARVDALEKFLKLNPDGLLDIPCAQLPLWKDVATHQVPQSVTSKIQNIKNQTDYYTNWEITDLDNGLGARLNMDLFPVKITTMPNKPDGQKYTSAEFFDFFRKNINLFAETFTPIEDDHYNIHDTALWNSSNPLGALIHIDITPDDGTVVCTGYWTNSWMFSTVKAPLSWGYDGVHPVAGNRLFSYYTNSDGSINIYTRGVDRVSHNFSNTADILNFILESTAFSGADKLWSDMQKKLSAYIISKGGSASIVQPEKYRPDYNKIKNYIKGNTLTNPLGCH